MGRDFKSMTAESNDVADAFIELLRPEFSRLVFLGMHFMIPEWLIRVLPFKENKTLNEIGTFLRSVCRDIIKQKKYELQEGGDLSEYDILSRIIQTGDFTDAEVGDQMLTFLAAGVSPQIPQGQSIYIRHLLTFCINSMRQQPVPLHGPVTCVPNTLRSRRSSGPRSTR